MVGTSLARFYNKNDTGHVLLRAQGNKTSALKLIVPLTCGRGGQIQKKTQDLKSSIMVTSDPLTTAVMAQGIFSQPVGAIVQ